MITYYPIGTIVTLENLEPSQFMIAGYLPKRADSKPYDYFGVSFPLGLLDKTDYICFDHVSITDVVHKGYSNEACQEFISSLDTFGEALRTAIINAAYKGEKEGDVHGES